MSLEDSYNKIYSHNETVFGGEPEQVVRNVVKYRTAGSAVELGAGEGRNSLFLASNGFEVSAYDISKVGIGKIAKRAAELKLNVQAEVADVRALNLQRNFDVVASTYMLHHLSREEALALVKRMQEHTNPEGLNAITVFTKSGDFYKGNPETDRFYPDAGELKSLYAEWDILEYEELEVPAVDTKPDGSQMSNVAARLLARKMQKSPIEHSSNNEKSAAFETLYQGMLAQDGGFVEYSLPYPKYDFLNFLVREKGVLLHGSNQPDIRELEPKQANCKSKKFGNMQAVYATQDSILPLFFAVRDRSKMRGRTESGYREEYVDGQQKKTYGFAVSSQAVLNSNPWLDGVVYILPSDSFEQGTDDEGHQIDEFVSRTPVKAIARLRVGPEDFPYLDKVTIKES